MSAASAHDDSESPKVADLRTVEVTSPPRVSSAVMSRRTAAATVGQSSPSARAVSRAPAGSWRTTTARPRVAVSVHDQASKSVRSFWRAGQLYELCTSKADNERAHCEGFITGLASTLQDAQLSRVPICIPKGTSSQDVVSKVVWYLREKADAEDLKLPAANLLGPVLAVLYNCTPGQPPKFTQPR